MSDQLPSKVDLLSFIRQQAELSGSIFISQLPRLRELLTKDHGDSEVVVKLKFAKDEFGIPYISGSIKTKLHLDCQRCGHPVIYDINLAPSLSPVMSDDAAAHVPKHYDPLLINDGAVLIHELIEDELLLSLPMIAKHDSEECL